jgi:hypothetical protein
MIRALFDSIKNRVRLLFTTGKDSAWREGYVNPRRDPEHARYSRKKLAILLGPRNNLRDFEPWEPWVTQEGSRERRKREWCRAFNVRQRWIVPDKSPESIYLKAVRPRKRRA